MFVIDFLTEDTIVFCMFGILFFSFLIDQEIFLAKEVYSFLESFQE